MKKIEGNKVIDKKGRVWIETPVQGIELGEIVSVDDITVKVSAITVDATTPRIAVSSLTNCVDTIKELLDQIVDKMEETFNDEEQWSDIDTIRNVVLEVRRKYR